MTNSYLEYMHGPRYGEFIARAAKSLYNKSEASHTISWNDLENSHRERLTHEAETILLEFNRAKARPIDYDM